MSLSDLSLRRSFSSYSKVQYFVSQLRRNRKYQLSASRIQKLKILDIGCGPNTNPHTVNLDYEWKPGVDVVWDISLGLPFPDGRFNAIFSEHVLEHFCLESGIRIIHECYRVLEPGGVLRVIVPDAELYLRTYNAQKEANGGRFPFEDEEKGRLGKIYTPLHSVNRVFYQDRGSLSGHCYMYDFETLDKLLSSAGFRKIIRSAYGSGQRNEVILDTHARAVESLYLEAIK